MSEPPNQTSPFSPEEEQSSEDMLRNMGHVMTAWQGVEHAVFDIFRNFFEPDHYDVAAAAFFAVQAFETRMQMVDALMIQFANESQSDKWERLHNKIRKKAKRRNEIAHGLFVFFGTPPKRKAALSPSIYDIRRFPDNPRMQDFGVSTELMEAANSFCLITKDVYDFIEELKQDAMLPLTLRARPQRVEENDRKHPLTVRIPPIP